MKTRSPGEGEGPVGPVKSTSKDGSVLQDWLFDEVCQVVAGLDGALTVRQVKDVFSRVLRDMQGEETSTPRETSPHVLRVMELDDRRLFYGERDYGLVLAVEVFSAGAFRDVRSQMIQNGALFVKIPESWPVNLELDVCVMLPIANLEIWFKGRVVHQSKAGIAFEVRPTSREHNAWWEVASKAFREGRIPPKMPSSGPVSRPPDADRRSLRKGRPQRSSTSELSRRSRPMTRSRPKSRPAPSKPAVEPEEPWSRAPDPDGLEAEMREKLDKLSRSTHFDTLGLSWSAYTEMLETSYFDLQRRFRLDRFPKERREALRETVTQMQEALDEAWRLLRDPQTRRRYRASFIGPKENARAVALYLEKAEMALMLGDEERGQRFLKHVLELDPLNSEARRMQS